MKKIFLLMPFLLLAALSACKREPVMPRELPEYRTVTSAPAKNSMPLPELALSLGDCESDADCISVPVSECPCSAGGATGAINKKNKDEYFSQFPPRRRDLVCPQWYRCVNAKPKCRENKCWVATDWVN